MMTRTYLLGELNRLFSIFETMLENGGRMALLDDNHCCEDIMCRVLNHLYGWKLVNLNRVQENYPGIDLGDEKMGLGLQVSSDRSSDKISETLEKVKKHRVYETFPHIKILILGKKQKSYSIHVDFEPGKPDFKPAEDIMDFSDLLKQCQSIKTETLQEICEYLKLELGGTEGARLLFNERSSEKIKQYMAFLEKENQYITILGLGEKLPIEQVWIQLSLITSGDVNDTQEKEQWNFLQQYDEYKVSGGDAYDVETVLADRENAVILAGPGMGKSTLCKKMFVKLRAAGKKVLKIRLFDVAGYMREGKSFVEAVCLVASDAVTFSLEREELDKEFDVLILDGLDECSDLQREVAKGIASWGMGHPLVRILVTSRPFGYHGAEFEEYRHFQILPLKDDELVGAACRLMQVLKTDVEEDLQWFEKQMRNRSARTLACRSPLLLGFLVQLSVKRKNISRYKVGLYKDIMQVWLEGSSRHNEKRLKDVELLEGVEAIAYYLMISIEGKGQSAYSKDSIVAYVGAFFQTELGVGRLQAKGMAEDCLEFWTQRGILEKSYVNGTEMYLFLHLNVGEYLAASHLAKKTSRERCAFIRENYRKSIWHETIRMLIACETQEDALEELMRLETQDTLPDGAVFLAAEGAAERESEDCPQELYERLLSYIQGDNPYLAQMAAGGAAKLKGKRLVWHEDLLKELWRGECGFRRNAAYQIYLSLPDNQQDYQVLREYILYYCEEKAHEKHWQYSHNLEQTLLLLKEDPEDEAVIEALKKIYYHHCSLYEMEQLDKYFERLGMGEWTRDFMKKIHAEMPQYDMEMVNRRLNRAEEKLVRILGDMYGCEPTQEDLPACVEYSKIAEVIELMERPVSELALLKDDLELVCAKALLQAAGVAAEVKKEKIAKEIYAMLTTPADSLISISGQRRVKVLISPRWEKTRGMVSTADIVEGLCSKSDIMGDLAMQVAYISWEQEGLREAVAELFKGNHPTYVYRAGILLLVENMEAAKGLVLERMQESGGEVLTELIQLLGKVEGRIEDTVQWEKALKRCLEYGRDTVRAVAVYLQGDVLKQVSKEALYQFLPHIRQKLEEWLQKKVRCRHCKEHPYLEERGYCPICHIGGEMPCVDLFKALLRWEQLSVQEMVRYMASPLYDMDKTAREGLLSFLEKHPVEVGTALSKVEAGIFPKAVFEVVLKLPPEIIASHGTTLLRLADGSSKERTRAFLKQLNSQKWLDDTDKRAYVEKIMQHECQDIRSEAMKAWLKR